MTYIKKHLVSFSVFIFVFTLLSSCTPAELIDNHENKYLLIFIYYSLCIWLPTILSWLLLLPQENVNEIRSYDHNYNKTTSYVGTGTYWTLTASQATSWGNVLFLLFTSWILWIGFIMKGDITLSTHNNLNVFLQFIIIPFIAMPFIGYLLNRFFGVILTYLRYIAGIVALIDLVINFVLFLLN